MASRFLILFSLLALLAAQFSFGAETPLSPRQKARKNPLPAADTGKDHPVNILSIIPAQGEPGITVTLYGTGFSEKTVVFLGNIELPAKIVSSKQLSFDIPKLAPGLYALYLRREDGTTSRPYNFTLLPEKPVVTALTPDTIYACATGREREATIVGRNFREGSQVLLDGAAIRGRLSSPESISITVPQIAAGLHQLQVRSPGDALSGVLGLVIDGRPEITGVAQGEEYVNYYNLIIDGRNFQQNSTLVVMEERTTEEPASRLAIDVKRITTGTATATERERLLYINCSRIIYQRYPYSSTPKNFRVQVVNPDGGSESSVVSVTAP